MPTGTYVRGPQNPYNVAGDASNPMSITGGTVPSPNRIIDISSWADPLQPTKTPILSELGTATRDQVIFYWGASVFPAHRTTLNGAITNNATSLAVATGDGVLFQPGSAFAIFDQIAGSNPPRYDYSTKEIVWIPLSTALANDTLTPVVRGMGAGGTGVAHTTGALIELLAPHEPYNQDHKVSPKVHGYQYYNNFARVAGGINVDKAYRNMPTQESSGDQLMRDMKTETMRLKLLLEKTVIHGMRQAGNPTTPLPPMFGGLLSFITTNTYNQAGATLSIPQLETALYDLWNKVDESASKRLLMSMNTARVFDTFLNPYRRADASDTEASFVMNRVKLRSGTYDITESRWMPDGVIAIVDLSECKLVNFKGLGWHTKDHATDGDYDWRSISGDFSLIVENESAMGLLSNFNTDLDQYAGRNYLV